MTPKRALTKKSVLAFAAYTTAAGLCLAGTAAFAQDISIDLTGGTTITERAVQIIALITIMSLAPSILVMVTSFTRIVVVLSLLRTAMGVQQSPPNAVIISLALFLSAFVMAPVFTQAYNDGITPLVNGGDRARRGLRARVAAVPRLHDDPCAREGSDHVRRPGRDRSGLEKAEDVPLTVLVPAFMISELQARLRDRLPPVRAVHHHRHGGRLGCSCRWA